MSDPARNVRPDHDDGAKPQLAVTNRGTRPRWSEEIRPAVSAEGKSETENDLSAIEKPHHAYVMGIIGDPYLWVVKCDQCPWLSQAIGPWADGKEADRQAEAHATDPDIERKAAEYAELWDRPDYDLLDDGQLQEHIDEWFVRHHEFARLREEATESGEGDRYRRLVWDSHVRATQGIREQRRRVNRVLRALEQERNSQREEWGGT